MVEEEEKDETFKQYVSYDNNIEGDTLFASLIDINENE